MRRVTWEQFVPNVDDNRARHARGESAIVFTIRAPSAAVWTQFWLALSRSETASGLPANLRALARASLNPEVATANLQVYFGTLDPDVAAILWTACVREVAWPKELWPGDDAPPTTGVQLWALRDELDSFFLYQGTLEALIERTKLDEGTERFLQSASALAKSNGAGPPGTAEPAAPAASTSSETVTAPSP